jgi:hypothetical protein
MVFFGGRVIPNLPGDDLTVSIDAIHWFAANLDDFVMARG